MNRRFGQRLAATHGSDQASAGEQIGDVVLAEVDEGEAEGQGVGPTHRPLDRTRLGERIAAIAEVAKCSEGIAAQGLPPSASYIFGQAEPQVSSPTPIMIRSTFSPVRPCSEAHHGGEVGITK